MSDRASRTFIGSIVCVDLVGYSTRSVAQQITIKEAFNRLLAQALERVREEDRIILDTGDGAAISFLGDPEQSLAVGLAVRDAMRANAIALGAANGDPEPGAHGHQPRPGEARRGLERLSEDHRRRPERGRAHHGIREARARSRCRDRSSRWSRASPTRTRSSSASRACAPTRTRESTRSTSSIPPWPPRKAAPLAPGAANAGEPGALVAFLEDKLKVGSAAVLLVALILAEGALLARKWRTPVPVVASAPETAPAKPVESAKPQASKPAPAKAVELPPMKAEPAPVAPKIEPKAEQKSEAKAAKPEAKPEPVKAARKEEEPSRTAAAEAFSPVAPNLVAIGALSFPAEAAARGIDIGRVKARLTIDAAGNVTHVQVLEARPRRFFDEEAARSLREWKFDRGPANRQYVADIEFKR